MLYHERMLLFTVPNCHQCEISKEKLEKHGIPYTEIKVNEKNNMTVAVKYNVKQAGTIIDTETGDVFEID